jgi:hypothetical protein
MPARNRDLRPDPQGRYRPYLGWEDGERRQHRFNLGTDKREAERRFAKLRELYDENLRVYDPGGQQLWSPLALSYAEKIARGEYRISYPPAPAVRRVRRPVAGIRPDGPTVRG